jgi:hypothetical protein
MEGWNDVAFDVDALERAIVRARAILALTADIRGSPTNNPPSYCLVAGTAMWRLASRSWRRELGSNLLLTAVWLRAAEERGEARGNSERHAALTVAWANIAAPTPPLSLRDAHNKLIHGKNHWLMGRGFRGDPLDLIDPEDARANGTGYASVLQIDGTLKDGRPWTLLINLLVYLELCASELAFIRPNLKLRADIHDAIRGQPTTSASIPGNHEVP